MAIVLPSKRIQALIIIVVALFVAYFLSTLSLGSKISSYFSNDKEVALTGVAEGTVATDIDTDNDGLKDWQEVLWGTDKNNVDTDGDGTRDGLEIEQGRDPKIAGPDDSLEKTRGISAASVTSFSTSVSVDPDNLSQTMSRDLFAKFMSLQSSGNLTAESQAELIQSVIAEVDPGSIPPKYTIADLRVVDTNKVSLKAYGNAMGAIVTKLQTTVGPQTGNDAALAAYQNAITSLRNTAAPGTLGLTHLQVLNNFNATYQMLVILANFQDDPVKALAALKSLQTNTDTAVSLFTTIATEFKNNGIIFEANETGNIWNNYR